MSVHNKGNEYEALLGSLFDKCPKTVLAAIAVSVLTQGGDYLDTAQERLLAEWTVLHQNGIVPQKPPTLAYTAAARAILRAFFARSRGTSHDAPS